MTMRIGVDLGGTKTEVIMLDQANREVWRQRTATPRHDYHGSIATIRGLIEAAETETGETASVGVGIPGSVIAATGTVQNGNSTWLNGKPMPADLEAALGRPVRMANDANCFALSEAADGAGVGVGTVFGVILGTGVGGGIVRDGRILNGPLGIAGEWGHIPLPAPIASEVPGPDCWCGRNGCMETWVSGPALIADHARVAGETREGHDIIAAMPTDANAAASFERYASRLARGLGMVVNLIDPDLIVLGGGMSKVEALYDVLPDLILPHIFADQPAVTIRPPVHGDSSGVRGAAWLWTDINPGL